VRTRSVVIAAVMLLVACDKKKKEEPAAKVADAAPKAKAPPIDAAPAAAPPTTGGPSAVTGKLSNLVKDAFGVKCNQVARDVKGNEGTSWYMTCPPKCADGVVWGTDLYTDDSAVCRAAIHAGAITVDAGGTVLVTWTPGAPLYAGSERNGIASGNWGKWGRSFFVQAVDADGNATTPPVEPLPAGTVRAGCTSPSANLEGPPGATWHVICPAGCTAGALYGTDVYTSDSGMCVAAVHAGLVPSDQPGEVDVVLDGPQEAFTGSMRNGVTSAAWGKYGGSFHFATKQP
jgi:hypothetical protein